VMSALFRSQICLALGEVYPPLDVVPLKIHVGKKKEQQGCFLRLSGTW
jgi:hypothetical protein